MKKIISLIISLFMIISAGPAAFAAEASVQNAVIAASKEFAKPGEEVTVGVNVSTSIEAAFGAVTLTYDSSKLTPVKYEFDEEFVKVSPLANLEYDVGTIKASFVGTYNTAISENILNITFSVGAGVADDTRIPIEITEIEFFDDNSNQLTLSDEAGEVLVLIYTLGDVNKDDKVSIYDAFLVLQKIVGLIELSNSQMKAADANVDNAVNILDAALIQRVDLKLETLPDSSAENKDSNSDGTVNVW